MRVFTKFYNEELEALICAGLSGGELTVFLHLARMTWGFGRVSVSFSPSSMEMEYRTARRSLASLIGYGVIKCTSDPCGPKPGAYSIGPVKEWDLPCQKCQAKGKTLTKMSGLPCQKCQARLTKMSGFSSGIPTPTSNSRPPKENSKERLLKTTPPTPQGEVVVEISGGENSSTKFAAILASSIIGRIEEAFGPVASRYRARILESAMPPAKNPITWARLLKERFFAHIDYTRSAWSANPGSVKSPIGLLVARLIADSAILRKESER